MINALNKTSFNVFWKSPHHAPSASYRTHTYMKPGGDRIQRSREERGQGDRGTGTGGKGTTWAWHGGRRQHFRHRAGRWAMGAALEGGRGRHASTTSICLSLSHLSFSHSSSLSACTAASHCCLHASLTITISASLFLLFPSLRLYSYLRKIAAVYGRVYISMCDDMACENSDVQKQY